MPWFDEVSRSLGARRKLEHLRQVLSEAGTSIERLFGAKPGAPDELRRLPVPPRLSGAAAEVTRRLFDREQFEKFLASNAASHPASEWQAFFDGMRAFMRREYPEASRLLSAFETAQPAEKATFFAAAILREIELYGLNDDEVRTFLTREDECVLAGKSLLVVIDRQELYDEEALRLTLNGASGVILHLGSSLDAAQVNAFETRQAAGSELQPVSDAMEERFESACYAIAGSIFADPIEAIRFAATLKSEATPDFMCVLEIDRLLQERPFDVVILASQRPSMILGIGKVALAANPELKLVRFGGRTAPISDMFWPSRTAVLGVGRPALSAIREAAASADGGNSPPAGPAAIFRRFILPRYILERRDFETVAENALAIRRRGSPSSTPDPLLPDQIERSIFDIAAIRAICDRFGDWLVSSAGREAGPRFGLARGLALYYRHDFTRAISELRAYALARPTSNGGLAARDIVRQLGVLPYEDPQWVSLMSNERGGPDVSTWHGRNILVLCEAGPDDVEKALENLPPDSRVTAAFPIVFDLARLAPSGWRYLHPARDVWYKEEGFVIHNACERLAETASNIVRSQLPDLRAARFGMKMRVVDSMLDDYYAVCKVDELLDEGGYDDLVVVTRRYSLFQSAQILAAGRLPADRVHASFVARPAVRKGPSFVYWPQASLPENLALAGSERQALVNRLKRDMADVKNQEEAGRPAVFVWAVRGSNDRLALRRMVEMTCRQRPVVVIATAGDPAETEAFCEELAAIVRAAGGWFASVQYDAFLKLAPSVDWATQEAARAVREAAYKPELRETLSRVDAAVMQADLPEAYVAQVNTAAMLCLAQWIDALCSVVSPAYVATAPGRNFIIASAIEAFRSHGTPALDVELSLIGNQARQLRSPIDFYATIDSGHADFAVETWGFPRERIVTVGYLWSALTQRPPIEPTVDDGRFTLLYATQPAPKETFEPIVDCIMQVAQEAPEVDLVIKLHPREERSAIRYVADSIERSGLGDRARIVPATDSIEPLLDRADLVVLRNSAVGLEAAGREKPLLRCLAYDKHLARVLLDVPYALNVYDIDAFGQEMRRLIRDPAAREEIRQRQRNYRALNPCLFSGGGHEVLSDYLENVVARSDRSKIAAQSERSETRIKRSSPRAATVASTRRKKAAK